MRIIIKYLINTNIIILITIGIGLIFLIDYIFLSFPFAESVSNIERIEQLKQSGPAVFFILAIIVIPFFETLIFQFFIINFIEGVFPKIRNRYSLLPILCSAFFFSINHCYNITYIIITFFVGLVLASFYYIVRQRKESALLVVFLIHALTNFIVFLNDYFF